MTALPELELHAAAEQPVLGGESVWRRRISTIAIVAPGALALLIAVLGHSSHRTASARSLACRSPARAPARRWALTTSATMC